MVFTFNDGSDSGSVRDGDKALTSSKLQQEAYLAMGLAGSVALIYASKGRNEKALAFAANSADDLAMRFMPETGPALGKGLKEFGEHAWNKASRFIGEVKPITFMEKRAHKSLTGLANGTDETVEQVAQGKVGEILQKAGRAQTTLPKIEHNYSVGSIPGVQFAGSVENIPPQRLDMINRWVVQGVKMEPNRVDLYLNKNGLDVALRGFPRPRPDLKPLDLLNTRITRVGSSAGTDGHTFTRVSLDMFEGGESYTLQGADIEALQFISKKSW
jgi:hypothetical protein